MEAAPEARPEDTTITQNGAENGGQVIRCRRGEIIEVEAEELRGGARKKKMLKMKDEPTMCMKTKTRMTILPTQKTAFLHS